MADRRNFFNVTILKLLTPLTLLELFGYSLAQGVTREDIIAAADSFATYVWYCSYYNSTYWGDYYSIYGCAEHQTCDFSEGFYYTGLAYAYGWDDELCDFQYWLDNEQGAGNHDCHYDNYLIDTGIYPPNWTTGIDCSGLVCNCWNIPRVGTIRLYSDYYPIEKSKTQMGDILVKIIPPRHAIIIEDPGPNPDDLYSTLSLYEATGSPRPAKVSWRERTWGYYEDYSARSRWPSIRPDGSTSKAPWPSSVCPAAMVASISARCARPAWPAT